MSRPLMLGSSHINALRRAGGSASPFDFKQIADFDPKHRLAQRIDGRVELLASLTQWLNENPAEDLILSISGHNYLDACLTEPDPPFDVILPWRAGAATNPKAQLIPFTEMRAMFGTRITYILDAIEALAAWRPTGVRLWWMEAPPPVGDNDYLSDWLANADPAWAHHRSRNVAPPALRMTMYLLQRRLIEACCEANDIAYIPHPSAATDGEGFLKLDLALDVCHGNERYGLLASQKVLGALQEGVAPRP